MIDHNAVKTINKKIWAKKEISKTLIDKAILKTLQQH